MHSKLYFANKLNEKIMINKWESGDILNGTFILNFCFILNIQNLDYSEHKAYFPRVKVRVYILSEQKEYGASNKIWF